MRTNSLIIALLILIILILISGIVYLAMFNNQNDDVEINDAGVENLTDNAVNATLKSDDSSSDNSAKHYDDWQKDYKTGEYDEYGSPIYRSVISTSGGQYEPGIYESYWSENGPISEERIG